MSVNDDWNGLEFVSSIEHFRFPFYGVQFHPEKNLYEWIRNKNISHTTNAIISSQFFAEYFVNEARKSDHRFEDSKEEDQYVIYNFSPQFTGAKGSTLEQCYMFPSDVDCKIEMEDDNGSANGTYLKLSIVIFFLSVLKLIS